MSSFSNWNGPGDCGGGASLPQVQTLEQLITRINALGTEVTSVLSALNTHIATDGTIPHGIGTTAQYIAAVAVQGVQATIGAGFTAANSVRDEMDNKAARLNTIEARLQGIATSAGSVLAAINAVNDRFGTLASSTVGEALQYLQAQINLKATPADIAAAVKVLSDSLYTDTLTLNVAIKTVNDIETGRINLRILADFKKWHVRSMPLRPIANRSYGNVVAIIGYLSKDYFADQVSTPNNANAHKSAIAFLKYANTKPWNALVQMTATPDGNKFEGHVGSISVLSAKTERRVLYPSSPPVPPFKQLPPLRFGLYKGTATTGGDSRIYLGVVFEETYGITYDTGSWVHNSGPVEIFVAGINFIPIEDGAAPNGGVLEICKADIYDDSSFATENISANEVRADAFKDSEGNNIWEETTDPNTGEEYLKLGNLNVHLELQSKDRPTVEHSDLSKHDIAYLSDLANSIYWQRDVTVIAENMAELIGLVVTIDTATQEILTFEASPASGHSNVPGIYTSDKTGPAPSGVIFEADNVALLKDGGFAPQLIADGKFNGVFDTALTYSTTLLTNIERDAIKVGSASMPTPADGTTFIDNNGDHFAVNAYNSATEQFQAVSIMPAQLYPYVEPGYATFDGAAWNNIPVQAIPVPETFDDYIHDVTYEWGGHHVQDSGWYIESYIMWTAHHQNHTSMDYTLDDWAFIELNMDGYRTADQQDAIDHELVLLGSAQADYTERDSVIDFKLPGQALPSEIANPAYIHHKPWTGVSIIDGGSFIGPLYYHDWMVDGGDFTGMATAVDPSKTPWVPSDRQYRNAIIKIIHGNYDNTPELGKIPTDPTWKNFGFTWRWLDDAMVAQFSNALDLYHFVPMEMFPAQELLQTIDWVSPVPEQLNTIIDGYEWSDPDPRNWGPSSHTFSIYSDTVTIDSIQYLTFQFNAYSQGFQITSPRLDKDEADIATLKADAGTVATDIATLQGDVGTLQSDVGTVQSDVGTLQCDMSTAQTNIANLEIAVPTAPVADGTYTLQVDVVAGVPTYSWV
jgi:prefoldin subunit 5